MRISDKKLVANAVKILHELYLNGARTQVELSQKTHLKRTSIFNLFEVLKAQRFVKESELITPAKGRPSVLWEIDGAVGQFLSVYFTPHANHYSIYDYRGNLLKEDRKSACSDLDQCIKQLEAFCEDQEFLGIAVAVSGVVDNANGEILGSTDWHVNSYPLAAKIREVEIFKERLVLVENNARTALWGEGMIGQALDQDNVLSLFMEFNKQEGKLGLGSSLILQGELYQGGAGQAGELEQFYYDYLDENGHDNVLNFSEVELNDFALNLAQKFSRLVNYLAPQKVIVQFEGDVLPENFYNVFSREIHRQKSFKYTSLDVCLSEHHEDLICLGAVDLLMRKYFGSSSQFVRALEKQLIVE